MSLEPTSFTLPILFLSVKVICFLVFSSNLVNLMAGSIAYTYLAKKPSIDLEPKELLALPSATF